MITALILGTVGSLHCLGMCGPIVIALPQTESYKQTVFYFGRLLYNFGRIITYMLMGLVFGAMGQAVSLAGFQSYLSIFLGFTIIASLFLPLNKILNTIATSKLWRKTLGALFQKKSFSAMLGIGFLNGFLPCGLVYTALAGAAASGDSLYGALFMAAFGLGTIPALLAVSLLGKLTNVGNRSFIRKALPVATFILGVLLILRGLSLGIPYISPQLHNMGPNQELFIPHCN